MATNITSTALDFENIKTRLKTYLAQKDEFSDYDFEASGLSNILDVLAYNTHFNGLLANFAVNESFLNTAQLRSSIVSHAESLGYRPRSITSSKAVINVYVDLSSVAGRPQTVELPVGTRFKAKNQSQEFEETEFEFRTRQRYIATDDGTGIYEFVDANGSNNVEVYEGTPKTKTFLVDSITEDALYVIPDQTIDTASLEVRVYESATSDSYDVYFPLQTAITVNAQSEFYDIKESPNGYYEINFGDGVSFGKKPAVGNKIVVSYTSSSGGDANGSNEFTGISQLPINGNAYDLLISSQEVSAGGQSKESVESIRKLAPVQFAAQQRLVTSLDYKGMILSNFTEVKDVSVWGGEDNVPIDYGKVYVSLQFKDNVSSVTQEQVKNNIVSNFTDNLSVMSITPKFVDPIDTFLELQVRFNYDPELTAKNPAQISETVRSYVINYFSNRFGVFGEVFRRSNLLTEIDEVERSILNSRIETSIQQRFTPTIGQSALYEIFFPVLLSPPDADQYIIRSSPFTYLGKTCVFQNELNSEKIQIVSGISNVVVDNAGYYEYKKGRIVLESFAPSAIIGGNNFIKVSATPIDQSVVSPLRNYVLQLDEAALVVSSIKEKQLSRIAL